MNRYLTLGILGIAILQFFSQPVITQTFGTWVRLHGVTLSSGRVPTLADINNPSAVTVRNNAIVEGCVEPGEVLSNCQPVQAGGRASQATPATSGIADGDAVSARLSAAGDFHIIQAPNTTTKTFAVTTAAFTPVATPTDLCVITGSASPNVIRVIDVRLTGTATAATTVDVLLVRRNAANSGGTFIAASVIPLDLVTDTTTVTVVGHYTANPTINATVGTISHRKVLLPIAGTATIAGANEPLLPTVGGLVKSVVLRSEANQLAVNFAGAALPAGAANWRCHFIFTED
jgi:hypothetical protein